MPTGAVSNYRCWHQRGSSGTFSCQRKAQREFPGNYFISTPPPVLIDNKRLFPHRIPPGANDRTTEIIRRFCGYSSQGLFLVCLFFSLYNFLAGHHEELPLPKGAAEWLLRSFYLKWPLSQSFAILRKNCAYLSNAQFCQNYLLCHFHPTLPL